MIITTWPKKNPPKKGPFEVMVVLEYPTGFSTYPSAGGWDEQDYLTTRYFLAALEGEQNGVKTMLRQAG